MADTSIQIDLADWNVSSFTLAVHGAKPRWSAVNRLTGQRIEADSRRELLTKIAATVVRTTYGGRCHFDNGTSYDVQRRGRHWATRESPLSGSRDAADGGLRVRVHLYECDLCGSFFAADPKEGDDDDD